MGKLSILSFVSLIPSVYLVGRQLSSQCTIWAWFSCSAVRQLEGRERSPFLLVTSVVVCCSVT